MAFGINCLVRFCHTKPDGSEKEWPRAAFLSVGPGGYQDNLGDDRMRARARAGDSGVGWSVCYRSKGVECWPGASSGPVPNPQRQPRSTKSLSQ